jgi:hypothetical protein
MGTFHHATTLAAVPHFFLKRQQHGRSRRQMTGISPTCLAVSGLDSLHPLGLALGDLSFALSLTTVASNRNLYGSILDRRSDVDQVNSFAGSD